MMLPSLSNTIETDLLLALVNSSLKGESAPDFPVQARPERLVRLICRQRLTMLVFPVIRTGTGLCWKEVEQALSGSYMRGLQKSLLQEQEISTWLSSAEAKGIDCLPLKGWLLRQLYPDATMRAMSDFDVLLREYDSAVLSSWMKELGYQEAHIDEGSYHDVYTKPPVMNIELHRCLVNSDSPYVSWCRGIWQRCTLEEGRQHIWNMTPEDFYIYLSIHMAKHFYQAGTGIRGIVDLYLYENAFQLNQEKLNRELERIGLLNFSCYLRSLAQIWFGTRPPDADSRLVTDYFADSGMYGTLLNKKTHTVIRSGCRTDRKNRLHTCLSIIFPGVQTMKHRFPSVERFPVLLPFFWVVRILRVLLFDRSLIQRHLDYRQISDERCSTARWVCHIMGMDADF